MFAYHPEEVLYTGEADPSPYELAMEQRRMERKMKQQVKKHGEEAMRSELKQEFDVAVPAWPHRADLHCLASKRLGRCVP